MDLFNELGNALRPDPKTIADIMQPNRLTDFADSRLGKFTGSEIHKLLKSGRKKDVLFGEGAMTYINEKIAEILTGTCKLNVNTMATEWGTNNEAAAVDWFTKITGLTVQHFGGNEYRFFEFNKQSGASPDGIVSDGGIFESKCPFNSANHIDLLNNQHLGQDYILVNYDEHWAQVQFEMMSCKATHSYLVSYDPRVLEPSLRMAIYRIEPDAETVQDITQRIEAATAIVRATIAYYDTLKLSPEAVQRINAVKLQQQADYAAAQAQWANNNSSADTNSMYGR